MQVRDQKKKKPNKLVDKKKRRDEREGEKGREKREWREGEVKVGKEIHEKGLKLKKYLSNTAKRKIGTCIKMKKTSKDDPPLK